MRAERRGLTVNTNEWLGAEVVSAADEGSVLFFRCQRGLCDWRDVTRGRGVHRRRQACGCGRHMRFPGTAASVMIIYRPLKDGGEFRIIRQSQSFLIKP